MHIARFILPAILASAPAWGQGPPPLEISVDARDARRHIVHVELAVPVAAGNQTLLYPQWIPGEHGPTGPINNIVDLQISSQGKPIAWERDPLDMYRLKIQVPAGVDHVDVKLSEVGGFSSEKLGVLSWNEVMIYPAGRSADDIPVHAKIQLPSGWTGVSALNRAGSQGAVALPPVNLTTLIDSPMLMGEYMTNLELKPAAVGGAPPYPHAIHITGERREAIKLPDKFGATLTRLVEETGAAFGSRHYAHYDWLLSLTEVPRSFGGLEHHQSSDNVMPEDTLLEEGTVRGLFSLLAHEFVHSWNGKYRRPAGLLSPDYQRPMDGRLLWVYEGLTTYLGEVLPARAGAVTPEKFRDSLAVLAATFEHEPGKRWRSLADTANSAQIPYQAPTSWKSSRRSVDFYEESVLLWLEMDCRLRDLSGDKICLDDFLRAFFGGESGTPALKPYVEEDVYAALNRLVPHDWRHDFRERLDSTNGQYFAQALERSGWKLVYTDAENPQLKESDTQNKAVQRMFSIGLVLNDKAEIRDVEEEGPAARGGVAPGMNLIAVNGRKYTSKGLDEAILSAHGPVAAPIRLLVESGGYYRELPVDWHLGAYNPHLVRVVGTPDRLAEIVKPRAPHS